jgi:general secretion pathway protein G
MPSFGISSAWWRIAVGKRQLVNENRNYVNRLLPSFTPHQQSRKVVKMKIRSLNKSGFTLVEIMIVVAIIGLLAAIAIPNFVKARTASQKNACIANLKQIEGAKATWALEQKKSSSDTPVDSDLFGSDKYIREKPACPGNGTYSLLAVDVKPTCTLATEGHSL